MVNNALRRALTINSVPANIILLTAMASYGAMIFAIIQGWPLWAVVVVTILTWLPVVSMEVGWTYRHYEWLALFYVLVLINAGHFMEHVVQMTQIHILGVAPKNAKGIISQLDTEWIHFSANLITLLLVLVLLSRFRQNVWLWVTAVVGTWHVIEHSYILNVYLQTGVTSSPGLLTKGGALGGGLPFIRPDMHFIYNLLVTVPLMLAFAYQLRRTYNEWLAKAFPHVAEDRLVEATSHLQALKLSAGATLVRQGDAADRFYIITQGEVAVTHRDEAGQENPVATLGPGQFFGEMGLLANAPRTATVTARTDVEVLAMDRNTFSGVVDSSETTAQDLAETVAQRRVALSS